MDTKLARPVIGVLSSVLLGIVLAVAAPSAATAEPGPPPTVNLDCGPGGMSWFYCATNSTNAVWVRWWWNHQPMPAWDDWTSVTGSCSGFNYVRVSVSNPWGTVRDQAWLSCSTV